MIGRSGERRSGISAQAARHDDDDDGTKMTVSVDEWKNMLTVVCSFMLEKEVFCLLPDNITTWYENDS